MNAANVMTEELQKDIDEARKEYKRGETLHFESAADAQKWMEALGDTNDK